jgi:superfamily II DNA or RNA helicase
VVSVVTGAGKTAFALIAYGDVSASISDLRIVVVVPTLALLDQWVVVLETDGGFSQADIATFSGEGRARKARRANVAVLNTARDLATFFADDVPTLLVVDECHRAGSPENARALEIPARFALGLSATPVREFDDGFERYVEPRLGPIIFEYDYTDASRDGVISSFALHNFRFALSPRESADYDRLTARIGARVRRTGGDQDDLVVKRLALERARVSIQSPADSNDDSTSWGVTGPR